MPTWTDRLLFAGLVALVCLAPLPLGSNRDWSWSLCAAVSALLALLLLLDRALRRQPLFLGLSPVIAVLFAAPLLWAWLQAQPWTPANWHHPIWAEAAASAGNGWRGAVSLSPDDTYTAIMRSLGYALVFFVALQLGRSRDLACWALWSVLAAGAAYALYGLLSYFGVLREFMWYADDAFGRDVRATFVNRNHFATWAGLALICALGAFFDRMLRGPEYPLLALQRRQERFDRFMARALLPLAGLILVVAALVSSHSRGGFISTFIAGVLLLVLVDRKQGIVSGRARAVAVAALTVSAVAFQVSSTVLLERFDQSGIDSEGREIVYHHVAAAIADNPWLGFGYGAFEDGFRLYRTESITKLVDYAHNSYLEAMFDLGIPAALAQFAALLGLLLTCIRGLRERHRDWIFPALGIAATVLVGIHALMDFSLQIPAVAILYSAIMGLACAQAFSSRESSASAR